MSEVRTVATRGGSGFVGRAVIAALRDAGVESCAVPATRLRTSGRDCAALPADADRVAATVRQLDEKLRGGDAVVNAAGLAMPGARATDELYGANSLLPAVVERAVSAAGVGRIYLDDFASRHDVPHHKFRNVNDPDAVERLRGADLDWLYVIGWSQMAKREVLSVPRRGVVGIQPTLLPVGRGRASIPWAIIKGLKETG